MMKSAEELRPGDVLPDGSVVRRAWVATNPRFVMIELEGDSVRTSYRYAKYNVKPRGDLMRQLKE
ncbi:hypothetical protein BI081_gp195 [Mycobacterium phage Tonenili]|uniref:Uncharacterized protein n=1 Tax=Mycobacterium phage Tonenili TaxID=1891703 RepID=A0A1C9EHF5_9CAUD|nr:hypothetical protein BI081_gp195 [Mycobacterium phage Tonenili]AON96912.1 hypothetical protein SEA_TONENILI_165 [Mycobacterium phage Tonenili]